MFFEIRVALVVSMLGSFQLLAEAQEQSHGTPDFLSHDPDRWALDFL
jgi:hypothetical protein